MSEMWLDDSNTIPIGEDFAISQVESDPYDYERLIRDRHEAIMDSIERNFFAIPSRVEKIKIIIKRDNQSSTAR